MFKPDQNLKVLEKKIRQAVDLISKLKAEKAGRLSDEDLPLLRSLSSPSAANADIKALLDEREEIRKRVHRLVNEIEKLVE